ncbi:MAG: hypothetical protein ACJAZO_000322 [Myxococcota bacterium]
MIAWLLAAALAADVEVVVTDGALHPGQASRIEVAVTNDDGSPSSRPPRLVATGADLTLLGQRAPGVWSASLIPDIGVDTVRISSVGKSVLVARALPVVPLVTGTLQVPRRVEATVDDATVGVLVTGDDLPTPEALVVSVGEGSVESVVVRPDGLLITVALDNNAYARAVPVGVVDGRFDAAPAWTQVRVRARPRLTLQTEPNATLALTIGQRQYGPFVASSTGVVTANVDQYPGERSAEAVFTDDLGNSTRTSLPLSSIGQDQLTAMVTGVIDRDGVPPALYLVSRTASGTVRGGAPPVCRTAAARIEAIPVVDDQWYVPLPDQTDGEVQELRLKCEHGIGVSVRPRVPVVQGVAANLRLRVWPESMSSDFPVAEVYAVVEDARGERLSVDGVTVLPEVGAFEPEANSPFALRGEYLGRRAISAGGDTILATYQTPLGGPDVHRWVTRYGPVPGGGGVQVFARALDGQGRPVSNVAVRMDAGAEAVDAMTGGDGWAQGIAAIPHGIGPLVLTAVSPGLLGRTVAVRGTPGRGGPSVADLSVIREVSIEAGRVDDLVVRVDPPVLYTGSGAVAFVTVDVKDRSGGTVADAQVELNTSEGEIGPLEQASDGSWRAEFTPAPSKRARDVTLTARAENVSASTRLILQPRPLVRAPAIGIGALTNFGQVTSPILAVDTDWRIPFIGGSTILRVGVATYSGRNEVDIPGAGKNTVQMNVVPISVSILARRELAARALWLGLGGVFAPYAGVSRFNEVIAARGVGVLPPGIMVSGGVGQRFGGGEVTLEARGIALASPGGPISFQGPVGGAALIVGYRLIY